MQPQIQQHTKSKQKKKRHGARYVDDPDFLKNEEAPIGGEGTLLEKVKQGRAEPKSKTNLVAEINYDPRTRQIPVLSKQNAYGHPH
jgi:hypothetical protein